MNNMHTGNALAGEPVPNREELLQQVLASDDLPTLPTVASKLVSLTSREETTLAEVAAVVSQDVALCTKILKVANSAFYSFPQQIGSISQAISMLGTNAVQSLVLSFSFMSMNKIAPGSHFDFDKFIERSLIHASMAKLIMQKLSREDAEEVFVAGLLQNLGELVLACALPERYDRVLEAVAGDPENTCAVEASMLGADHCFIGYEIAKHWNFPTIITLPILQHHDPREYVGDDEKTGQYIRAIYLSNLLVNVLCSETPELFHARFQEEAEKLLGLSRSDIQSILETAHTEVDEAAANFGLEMENTRPVQEILQEANIRLSVLNLDYEQVNKQLIRAKIDLENLTRELREKNEVLKQMADMDGLTGVYNNRFFQQALDKEMSRAIRQGEPMALVLADIDHFKRFNDDHGHLVGDFVIAEFCRVLTAHIREYDTLARYGGEEFVIVLPQTTREQAIIVAEKLRRAVEKAAFIDKGESYSVTASFGVAALVGTDEVIPANQELIKMADEALYDAKGKGRNRVAAYGSKKKWFTRK